MFDTTVLQSLVFAKYRPLLSLYCKYLHMGWKHFYTSSLNSDVKLEKIRLLERAIRQEFPLKQTIVSQLQKQFLEENLSLSLLLEPLQAWKYLSMQPEATSGEQISDIMGYIVSPLARLLMVLNNNENPGTYLPMQSLLSFLFWHYLFIEKSYLIVRLKFSAKSRYNKMDGLLKNSFILLSIVRSKYLKWKLAILLNKLRFMLENNEHLSFSFLDHIQIFLYSLIQFIVVRQRTLSRKEI